jgi:hypothetical protein
MGDALLPWVETFGVTALGVIGVILGHFFSKCKTPYWLIGYIAPFILLIFIGLSRLYPSLESVAPFSWLMRGRTEFAATAVIATLLLVTPLGRVRNRRLTLLVCFFLVCVVTYYAILPFLLPAVIRRDLLNIQTRFDKNDVCIQSTTYTCGPAAAVTALRKMGIPAEEGEIAVISNTSPISGTPADSLRIALNHHYGDYKINFHEQRFHSVSELRDREPAIAIVKFSFLVDHYIAVLDVMDKQIIVGDPIGGRKKMSYEKFGSIWRKKAILISRIE